MGAGRRAGERRRAWGHADRLVDKAIKDGFIDERKYVERRRCGPGQPEEIAKAVAFLASEEDASFIMGDLLIVDGGWTAYGYVPE